MSDQEKQKVKSALYFLWRKACEEKDYKRASHFAPAIDELEKDLKQLPWSPQ